MNHFLLFFGITVAFLSMQPLCAQQPLNLDFEKISAEGSARPWGWAYYQLAPGAEAKMDSTVVFSGKYSFKIAGKDSSEEAPAHTLGYWIDPWGLKGQELELQGWVKTESLAGNVRITLESWGEDGKLDADTVDIQTNSAGSHSTPWTPVRMGIKVDTTAYSIIVTVGLAGKGDVWFDTFNLSVNGQNTEEVAVAPAFSPPQLKWLSRQAAPLEKAGATMSGGQPSDPGLAAFRRIAGDAQLIALGESTHGTSEFFRLKHRLLEYAVKEMGVSVFAIEANQLAVEQINSYVLQGEGDARTAMKVMFKVWNTEEMLALIEWMRAYNLANPEKKVEFVGFDMQDPQLPIDSLQAFLADVAPDMLPAIDSLLRPYREAWRQQYYPPGPDSLRQNWADNAGQAWQIVSAQEENWLRKAGNPSEKKRVEWAMQNARVIRQAARTALSQDIASRDTAMAENIGWLLAQHPPGTRMIIWAHDSHISRGESPDPLYDYFQGGSMGGHLARKYGDNYRAFGLSTYAGTYSATLNFQNRALVPVEAFPSPRGSLDEALHRIAVKTEAPGVLLDLRQGRALPWLRQPRPVRFVGYMASDYSYEAKITVPYQFDGLFFIDKTSHSRVMK